MGNKKLQNERAKFIFHAEVIFEGDRFRMAEGSDLPGGMDLSESELEFCNHVYSKLHNAFQNVCNEIESADKVEGLKADLFKKITAQG